MMPPSLRLLSLALATTLLAQLHAQQPMLAAAATLPEAPSALIAPQPPQNATPYATRVIVNGRPYVQPTARQSLKAYESDLLGVRPVIHAAIRGAIEQARTVPTGWGQDFPGYAQRFGSAYGEAAISTSVRFGMAAALHEDVRYLICHHCSWGDKLANASLYEVTARHGAAGRRVFSPTPIVASVSGPLVAYAAWYPPGYDSKMALKHVPVFVVTRFVFNVIREFAFDRDTPEEKASQKTPATP